MNEMETNKEKINNKTFGALQMNAEAIDTEHISTETVDTEHVSAETVDTEHVSTETVDTEHVSTETFDIEHVSTETVDTEHISIETVDCEHINSEPTNAELNINESRKSNKCNLPLPMIFNENNFSPQKYIRPPFMKTPINDDQEDTVLNTQNIQVNMENQEQYPCSLGYFKSPSTKGPINFTSLLKYSFQTKNQVSMACRNISIIEQRSIYTAKSENKRIVFKCSARCGFTITWKFKNDLWVAVKETYQPHTCSRIR